MKKVLFVIFGKHWILIIDSGNPHKYFFLGCVLIFEVNALQCYVGEGNSPNSGKLTTCMADAKYCQVSYIIYLR